MHKYISMALLQLLFTCFTYPTEEPRVALITGITGQDGAYLASFLLEKGYCVHGIKRKSSSFNTERIDALFETYKNSSRFYLHYGDLTDFSSLLKIIRKIEPQEIYNLGAQSHVGVSFELPEYTADVNALGTLRILEAIRALGLEKKIKFYQASTSEMFGLVQEPIQTETTPFYPRSPYGVAKLFGYWITKNYREAYGMFACNGILFNHESPIRGETFVTRKITRAIAAMVHGSQEILYLGNIDASRDWGYAQDYVEAMWLMLQQNQPDDYIIATGQTHTVREFVEKSFKHINIEIEWQGSGMDEVGINKVTRAILIKKDPRLIRPSEVEYLIGSPLKAAQKLGWIPKTSFEKLVEIMVDADIKESSMQR